MSDLIYDVGMNSGDDTAYYLHLGYRVVAVEADPDLVARCERRFAEEIRAGRLVILNCAIGPVPGSAKFWRCLDKPEWNSFRKALAGRCGYRVEEIDVCVRRFGSILAEHGTPHYLKVDIEGHDIYCLEDLDKAHLPRYLSVEVGLLDELLALRELGYDRFKLVLQGQHRELKNETRSLSGWLKRHIASHALTSYVARKVWSVRRRLGRVLMRARRRLQPGRGLEWIFPHGSSGPFGEDAPGSWISFEEACLRWLDHVHAYRGYCWCDLHATLGSAALDQATTRAA
jgi:FkbM family methyltransferase